MYDKQLLSGVIEKWTENSVLTQNDLMVKYGKLYLCGYSIDNDKKRTSPDFTDQNIKNLYQDYYKSLIDLKAKLSGDPVNFSQHGFTDGQYADNFHNIIGEINDLLCSIRHYFHRGITDYTICPPVSKLS